MGITSGDGPALVTDKLLVILVQHFVDEHVIVVDRNILTQLLFVSQGDSVGLPFRVSDAALQVGVVEAFPPSQPISWAVKAKAWHQDQVQTSYGGKWVLISGKV